MTDNNIDVEDVRLAMQAACRQYLEGNNPFTPELLSLLCSTYLLVEAYADTIGNHTKPGYRAAKFLDRLRTALPDRVEWPDAKLKKMSAKHFGVTMDALAKALQRKSKPKTKTKTKPKRTK